MHFTSKSGDWGSFTVEAEEIRVFCDFLIIDGTGSCVQDNLYSKTVVTFDVKVTMGHQSAVRNISEMVLGGVGGQGVGGRRYS